MRTRIAVLMVIMIAGAGLFLAGRASAPKSGRTSPPARNSAGGDYAAGHAAGLLEGRAEQATLGSAANEKAVFQSGYAGGANDVFGGYDGGWDFDAPYVVVLTKGASGITYRIVSRDELAAGHSYHLCPDGHTICE